MQFCRTVHVFISILLVLLQSSHSLPLIGNNNLMLNNAFKSLTGYYDLPVLPDMTSMDNGQAVPRLLADLYQTYAGKFFPIGDDVANTVKNIKTEVGLVNEDTMFVFNLTSISNSETIIHGDLQLFRNKQRRRQTRVMFMTLYEIAPYYITQLATYALDDYRQGWQYVPVTDVVRSCLSSRRSEPHVFALGFSKQRRNGKIKSVHVDRFLKVYATPVLFIYSNSSLNLSSDFVSPAMRVGGGQRTFVNPETGKRESFGVDFDEFLPAPKNEKEDEKKKVTPEGNSLSTTEAPVRGGETSSPRGLEASITTSAATPRPEDKDLFIYNQAKKEYKWRIIKQSWNKEHLNAILDYKQSKPRGKRSATEISAFGNEEERREDNEVGDISQTFGPGDEQSKESSFDVFQRYKDAEFLFDGDYSQLNTNYDAGETLDVDNPRPPSTRQSKVKVNDLLPLVWPTEKQTNDKEQDKKRDQRCGLRDYNLDFTDIGWGDKVIAPTTLKFNYCQGKCNSLSSAMRGFTNHAVLQSLAHTTGVSKNLPTPCCLPHTFSPVTILYRDENENVVLKTYPDITVTSCGCA